MNKEIKPTVENNNEGTNAETGHRRSFLEKAALLGAATLLTGKLFGQEKKEEETQVAGPGEIFEYHHNDPENMIYTSCLGCNTGCPTKIKIQNGAIVKIDGNPYTPWTKVPHIPYKTPITEAARIDGHICPKGQAGMMTMYDPHRITKVLKRDGPRGSMKWKTIDFHQAVEEIINGGILFANVPGEETRKVEGIKDVAVKIDKKVADEMSKVVDEIWAEKDKDKKKELVAKFKETFKDHLHLLINPDYPEFGPKNNQFVWTHGRLKGGRGQFFPRFVQDGLGSANYHGHTTVCQGSLYFNGKAVSEQFGFDEKKRKITWHGGQKFYWQADQSKSEFIIFVGTSPFEANYPPLRTPNITTGVSEGRLKYVVIDPRYSKTAAHATKWLPAKPGAESAIAMGMIRWMLENKKYDEKYLLNANMAAAKEDKDPNFTNACWLVQVKDGKAGAFVRGSQVGLPVIKKSFKVKEKDGTETEIKEDFDPFVVMSDGKLVAVDNNAEDEKSIVHGDLYVNTKVKGKEKDKEGKVKEVELELKSALQLLKEEADKHTIEEWANIADISTDDLLWLAKEFTSHGKKAVCDIHRGVSQHTNGFYQCYAFNTLNLLIGNYDWAGGSSIPSTYDITGGKSGAPYDFSKGMTNGKVKPFGLNILRPMDYEKSTLFDGKYPAKRPWFPHATDVYQEILPSMGDAYPYPVKIWMLYMGTPGYALPAGQKAIEIMSDVNKIPLFIASDIMIGSSTMYADYIFPDIAMYERWEFHGSHPCNIWKVQPVRNPAINSPNEIVTVFGKEMPISMEAFMLAVAEKMKLKGFGKDGLGDGSDFFKPEDFYLKQLVNLACGEKPNLEDAVPDADDAEVKIFKQARRHLHPSVFEFEYWKKQMGEHWRKAIYVLNRGGRYQDFEKAYDGKLLKNKWGKQINMYSEKVAKSKSSMTGKSLKGLATHLPIVDSLDNAVKHGEDTLILSTYREIFKTKNRTHGNPLLNELMPENFILINSIDAKRLGFRNKELVRIVSDSNPEGVWELPNFGKKHLVAKLKVTEGIRPGVVTFSLGYGTWANGSADYIIDGKTIKGNPANGTGIMANSAMMIDPHLKNVSLQDLVGGSVVFYDSPVRLVKVKEHIKNNMELV